ncbi:MAG: 2-oxoglutarate dehydrogenase E1 component [Legionellales bacterium]|nr:2-oxoglutarate dehydrogenase E1 component [Legionellales bacterium]
MTQPTMTEMWDNSFLYDGSSSYLESLFEDYLRDPNTVDSRWRQCFDQLPKKNGSLDVSHAAIRDYFRELSRQPQASVAVASGDVEQVRKQTQVMNLINAYRSFGHHAADLDPLKLTQRVAIPALDLAYHGLSASDLTRVFNTGTLAGQENASLQTILDALQKTYCGTIGVEYMHISNTEEVRWLQERLEQTQSTPKFNPDTKKHILRGLTHAEGLEKYLGSRYVGQKRFSLEGGESLIPLLDTLVQNSGSLGVKEIVLGMAHRGRLNVLVNILGKSPEELFHEFEGKKENNGHSGDVKYHMGFSSDVQTPGGIVHLALAFNPSHLEIINPVVEGSVRARQDRHQDAQRNKALPILIHGDAAFAGQGVVMETLNMSQARGFATGGTIHIIINNQIGFTTSNPLDARSTLYCSDIVKMIQAPVFHVNGDDPEAIVFVTQLAVDYRFKFNKDILIDLVCYRRHGHNEADEPSATQPIMYKAIKAQASTRTLYAERLIQEQVTTQSAVEKLNEDYRAILDKGQNVVQLSSHSDSKFAIDWTPYTEQNWRVAIDTSVPLTRLQELGRLLTTVPDGFKIQAQVQKEYENRAKMAKGELPLNWGFAETLAYATLIASGNPVRLCGQDCQRGTFSHRQCVLHDQNTGELYTPLHHLTDDQARFTVIDSFLSEEAVLGFEYGYASSSPKTLVIWEAQFGDFANGAQVVIDQFISSGEQKWGRLCGLTLLLPHGYEGMGPEHSSARLERYLQLCAQKNMQVCVPTTPAQVYHMLRRQQLRTFRKPLIVMSPKSLLRHKLAVSNLEELANGKFQAVINEIDALDAKKVQRVILCSGKVYYDLLERRRQEKLTHCAIIRLEQQYPFPKEEIIAALKPYTKAKEIIWCQEEPKNQGAWYFLLPRLQACLNDQHVLSYAGRAHAAAPATGSPKMHQAQQNNLVEKALGLTQADVVNFSQHV